MQNGFATGPDLSALLSAFLHACLTWPGRFTGGPPAAGGEGQAQIRALAPCWRPRLSRDAAGAILVSE